MDVSRAGTSGPPKPEWSRGPAQYFLTFKVRAGSSGGLVDGRVVVGFRSRDEFFNGFRSPRLVSVYCVYS